MRLVRTWGIIIGGLAAFCLAASPIGAQGGGRARRAERRFARARERAQRLRERSQWSGSVDDVTQIFLSQTEVREDRVSGKSTENVRFSVSSPLPRRHVRVFLRRVQGRGQVRIIQQPTSFNRYTAGVQIRDKAPGRGRYRFMLAW